MSTPAATTANGQPVMKSGQLHAAVLATLSATRVALGHLQLAAVLGKDRHAIKNVLTKATAAGVLVEVRPGLYRPAPTIT